MANTPKMTNASGASGTILGEKLSSIVITSPSGQTPANTNEDEKAKHGADPPRQF